MFTGKNINSVVVGVLIALATSGAVTAFNLYTDTELLKLKVAVLEKHNEASTMNDEKFVQMMHRIDTTLAVQTETLTTLRTTVNKLEETVNRRTTQ